MSSRFVLPFAIVFAGCGAPEIGSTAVAYDSAGIAVVESSEPQQPVWDLTAAGPPLASFGQDEEDALGSVSSAVRLESGSIVFIEFLSRELKMFLPGSGLRDIARPGSGPGEVVFPTSLQRLAGDSIQIYDRRLGRVSVFTPAGTLAYDIPLLRGDGGPPLDVWRLQDTLLVGQILKYSERQILGRSRDGNIGALPIAVALYGMNGVVLDTIEVLQPGPMDIEHGGSSLSPAYGHTLPFAVTPSGTMVHGTGEQAVIRIFDVTGQTRRIHRLNSPRQAVDPDSLLRILAGDKPVGGGGPMPRVSGAEHPALAPEFLPDSQPAYKNIRVFDGDQVWLGSAEPFNIPSKTWSIVSNQGRWLGTVKLPENTLLLDVRDGHLVVRRSNSLDVQYVEVYSTGELFSDTAKAMQERGR